MTLSEFISEIESKYSTLKESGNIDKISIKLTVINELKRFGNNIAQLNEKVLDIRNSQAELPEQFKSLKLALKLEPKAYEYKGDVKNLTENYLYYQRVENAIVYDNTTQRYVESCCPRKIEERITINGQEGKIYYNWDWLSLTKGINKKSLSIDCHNIHPSVRNSYPHEISINNNMLNTNFPEGVIYIQYYSLPVDENDEIIIPETSTNALYRYIENAVKILIVEDAIANNQNPQAMRQLYEVWMQQNLPLRKEALVETKFAGLGKDWTGKIKRLNQTDMHAYVLPSVFHRRLI